MQIAPAVDKTLRVIAESGHEEQVATCDWIIEIQPGYTEEEMRALGLLDDTIPIRAKWDVQ